MDLNKLEQVLEESGSKETIAQNLMKQNIKDSNAKFKAAMKTIVGEPPLSPNPDYPEDALASVIIPITLPLPLQLVMRIQRLVNSRQKPFVEILDTLVPLDPKTYGRSFIINVQGSNKNKG